MSQDKPSKAPDVLQAAHAMPKAVLCSFGPTSTESVRDVVSVSLALRFSAKFETTVSAKTAIRILNR